MTSSDCRVASLPMTFTNVRIRAPPAFAARVGCGGGRWAVGSPRRVRRRAILGPPDPDRAACHEREVPRLVEAHLPRVLEEGRRVRGPELLGRPVPDDGSARVADPRG